MAPFNNCRRLLARLAAPAAVLALLSTPTPTAQARLEVAKTLGDHMVLQRAPHRAAIYGHADPFARVSVAVRREQNATATMVRGCLPCAVVW